MPLERRVGQVRLAFNVTADDDATFVNALVAIHVSIGIIGMRLRVGRAAQEAVKDNICAILKVSNPEYNCSRLLDSVRSTITPVSGRK